MGHVDTTERSNEPIYFDDPTAASGGQSCGTDPQQDTTTGLAMAATVNAVRKRIE